MALATQPLVVMLQAYLGEAGASQDNALNYSTEDTAEGAIVQSVLLNVLAGQTTSFNLATYFPNISSCQFVAIMDVTNPTQAFTFGNGASGMIRIAAGSPVCWMQDSTSPPTIYLGNPGAATSQILVTIISL